MIKLNIYAGLRWFWHFTKSNETMMTLSCLPYTWQHISSLQLIYYRFSNHHQEQKLFRNTHLWPFFYCIWCEITRFKWLVIDSNSWLVPGFLFDFSPLNLLCKHTLLLQMYTRARMCTYIYKFACRGLLKDMHAHTHYAL